MYNKLREILTLDFSIEMGVQIDKLLGVTKIQKKKKIKWKKNRSNSKSN